MKYLSLLMIGALISTTFLSCKEEPKKNQEKEQVRNKLMTVSRHDMTLLHEYSARFTGCQILDGFGSIKLRI